MTDRNEDCRQLVNEVIAEHYQERLQRVNYLRFHRQRIELYQTAIAVINMDLYRLNGIVKPRVGLHIEFMVPAG